MTSLQRNLNELPLFSGAFFLPTFSSEPPPRRHQQSPKTSPKSVKNQCKMSSGTPILSTTSSTDTSITSPSRAIAPTIILPPLDHDTTIILLALAHLSGWSAERISLKLREKFNQKIAPEHIYALHQQWASTKTIGVPEIKRLRNFLLEKANIEFKGTGKPLYEQPGGLPITIKFAKRWNPKQADNKPLFKDYSMTTRAQTISFFLSQFHPIHNLHLISPSEQSAIAHLGPVIGPLLIHILSQWHQHLKAYLSSIPAWKKIKQNIHADLIISHLDLFKGLWEQRFGKMAEYGNVTKQQLKEGTFVIRSSGQGVKVLLGLMLADRSIAVDKKREDARLEMGFLEVDVRELEPDGRNCSICSDEMGRENDEGECEQPVRIVYCCAQVVGRRCLALWLDPNTSPRRWSCPVCRTVLSGRFVDKLCSGGVVEEGGEQSGSETERDEEEVVDLDEG